MLFSRSIVVCALLCLSGIAAPPGAGAQQAPQLPTPGSLSTLRLVAEAGLRNGTYVAGVDLAMAPGSHTYWKMPGEAGVPPVFTFSGSENVKSAIVRFPVPQRISEDGIDAFGYSDRVVFPVLVTPVDPARPARLHVDVTYAVCNRICLPGHGEATAELQPRGAGVSAELVRGALALVPRPAPELPALRIAREPGAADPSWTLNWSGAVPPRDIFPDAPEGYAFSTRKTGADSWILTAASSVTAPTATTVPVTLVLAGEGGATEFTRVLDLKPTEPEARGPKATTR